MSDWGDEEGRKVGRAIQAFIITTTSPSSAVDAWRLEYSQLNALFEIDGFKKYMVSIAELILMKSRVGVTLRVGLGALLSTLGEGATQEVACEQSLSAVR